MNIQENRAIALVYTLTIDNGIVADSNSKEDPLWYLHGRGQLLPKFEEALAGLEVGQTKHIVLAPKDGYGEYQAAYLMEIPKSRFSADSRFGVDDPIEMRMRDGNTMRGRVKAVGKDALTVNFNHELAGQTLTFDVEVLEVRNATREELVQGVVGATHAHHEHGPNCNHGHEHTHGG